MKRPDPGDWKIDNAWPVVLGLLIGLAYVLDGGGWWALIVAPAGCCGSSRDGLKFGCGMLDSDLRI
jgi:hypothetical protein